MILAGCGGNSSAGQEVVPEEPPINVPDDATLPVERRIEAISFLGDTLSEFPLPDNIRAQREQQFEEARQRWVVDPANIDNIIWAGRRAAYLGRYQEAREHHERALAIAREMGDRQDEAKATGNLGSVFRAQGRLAEAKEHHERNLALVARLDLPADPGLIADSQ